ncbi:homoserine dehydrogenase family protein [Flavobacterium sp. MAHUQ-51]|uniref:aspartate kinase n=1 Tax=Flavobacterium sp. GCM10022190 TaxID=3252639 RepID=UPI00360CB4F3
MPTHRINIVLFGVRNIGSALIREVIKNQQFLLEQQNIDLRFPIIANSSLAFIEKENQKNNWETDINQLSIPYTIEYIIERTQELELENLIAIDATSGAEFAKSYIPLIQNNFDIISVNNIANTLHHDFYTEIRRNVKKYQVEFEYESNISPGLRVIEKIKKIQASEDTVTKIRALASSSISYIFSRYGNEAIPFSRILQDAEKLGYTQHDSREDLSGIEIARKLLIIARELDQKIELRNIQIQSLLPETINKTNSKLVYNSQKKLLDRNIKLIKQKQKKKHVLRYIGEIDLVQQTFEVKLVSEPIDSNFGKLNAGEHLIELYTLNNGTTPITIQGAPFGKQNTVKSILNDILKIAERKKTIVYD